MKLETFKNQTTEVFIEHEGFSVTATPWSNCEGCNVLLQGKDLAIRGALSLQWEELDVLLVALTAARAC